MYVKGANADDLRTLVRKVSARKYEGNLVIKDYRDLTNRRGPRASFTLRVEDSRGPGAKRSSSGRRGPWACWHTHWDVLKALFVEFPQATVKTAIAAYDADNFEDRAEGTRDLNVGSMIEPAYAPDLCDCDSR